MNARDDLLDALIKEILGPRDGPTETLLSHQDPRNEYITGILAPRNTQEVPGIEAEADLLEEGEAIGEEDEENSGTSAAPAVLFSPALNPKALPHSMGLSFVVEGDISAPIIEICATWGRYQHPQGSTDWQRAPKSLLTGAVPVTHEQSWADLEHSVALYLRSHRLPGVLQYRVSVFMVNTVQPKIAAWATSDELLFQPQIRIHVPAGCRLVPISGGPAVDEPPDEESEDLVSEDRSLALLYRERRPLARGHLCGLTWQGIDPERPLLDFELPDSAPYRWVDVGSVPAQERHKFTPATVRTEFIPCYPIEAPDPNWRVDAFTIQPELNPEKLADLWSPEEIEAALQPLSKAYDQWIHEQHTAVTELAQVTSGSADVATGHIQQCEHALHRIQDGIQLLQADPDVRLAFCFANKAISLQSSWANNGVVRPWRPFQLAFILLNITGIALPDHPDRSILDLLWFPTGGGKTEAYLGLAAFALALRRRRSSVDTDGHRTGGGVGVLSRYTLRLLTIQQFRRALGVVTACELLRVSGLAVDGSSVGWRPPDCSIDEDFLWGTSRFAAGLWVGGGVTPNGLHTVKYRDSTNQMVEIPGALDLLQGVSPTSAATIEPAGEPAQVLACPACRWFDDGVPRQTLLAVPDEGLGPGRHRLHLVLTDLGSSACPQLPLAGLPNVQLSSLSLTLTTVSGSATLTLDFLVTQGRLRPAVIDRWWNGTLEPAVRSIGNPGVRLACTRPSRPGYFFRMFLNAQKNRRRCDFDLYCPNPECVLNGASWAEKVPVSVGASSVAATDGDVWQEVSPPFRTGGSTTRSSRIPIPALTVDDQIYHRCPSLVIATVDKFARLAFEPKAGTLFGAVERYHSRWGYYRAGCPPSWGALDAQFREDPRPAHPSLHRSVPPFSPPDLILQDELHLIEGPLGSMVGLYETAIDLLCQRTYGEQQVRVKYVASTATVRQAGTQVQALFDRTLSQFPPPALSADDSFFAWTRESHPLEAARPGRLYVGVCAPGRGAQTPIIRIWAALMQAAHTCLQSPDDAEKLDQFWTVVGYFNAIRELAGAKALYRQDIREWIHYRSGDSGRNLSLDEDRPLELSSRADSLALPGLLDRLGQSLSSNMAEDAVLATSMFGTGVDVNRLGLMVVHGQPKNTASYIQATGRVGRSGGGLVVVFLRASRPRDLDHYEFFTAYHRALNAYVEPVTVAPFSPRAREHGLGPVLAALLRQARTIVSHQVPTALRVQQRLQGTPKFYSAAARIADDWNSPAVQILSSLLEARSQAQPPGRRALPHSTEEEAVAALHIWRQLAEQHPGTSDLLYNEPALTREPEHPVVLGDPHHQHAGLDSAYRNAPNSLREVEATTRFKG